jgi:hypothetical protein
MKKNSAIKTNIPDTTLVFDSFHFIKLISVWLSHVNRQIKRYQES